MASELLCTRSTRMKAQAHHGVSGSRVEITILGAVDRNRVSAPETTINVAFDCPDAIRKADAYAAAINVVDDKFHPRPTLASITSRVGEPA